MPTKKPQSKVKRQSTKKVWLWMTLSIVVVVLLLGLGVWWFFGGGAALSEQRKMEAYLEEKYGQEFVVERPKRIGSGIGVEGTLSAKAYPQEDKRIKFIVSTNSSKKIWDSYPSTKWEFEERPKVEAKLATIFTDTPKFTLNMGARELEMKMGGEVPRFDDFSENHKNDITYTLRVDAPELTKDQAERYTPSVAQYLATKNAQTTFVFYFNDAKIVLQSDEITTLGKTFIPIEQFVKPLEASRR